MSIPLAHTSVVIRILFWSCLYFFMVSMRCCWSFPPWSTVVFICCFARCFSSLSVLIWVLAKIIVLSFGWSFMNWVRKFRLSSMSTCVT